MSIAPAKQLMITDLSVVNDPVRTRWTGGFGNPDDGAWHFGRLLAEMAGDKSPAAFVQSWFSQWERDIELNGQVAPPRGGFEEIVDLWPKTASGELDLTQAPFRLNAIVNRFDLREGNDVGESRFVFGLVDQTNGEPLDFLIILEYRVPVTGAAAALAWARQWEDLGAEPLGSAAYLSKLRALTTTFTRRGAAPAAPNGSAISQVRTNEFRYGGTWDLREFHMGAGGELTLATLALTPVHTPYDRSLNNTPRLGRYLRENAAAIVAQTYTTPDVFGCGPFTSIAVTNEIDFWTAPGVTDTAVRHKFSLNTCNGCHGAETDTNFMHIEPRAADAESALSPYLTGTVVMDPVTREPRSFNELESRAGILRAFLCANPR